MEEKSLKIDAIEELPKVVDALREWLKKTNVVVLIGDLGSGKTTFTKVFCKEYFGHDEASSPTYSLINLYKTNRNHFFQSMAHMDLYRIKTMEEALNAGVDEYLCDPTTLCFIEWPQLVENLVETYVQIKIDVSQNGTRNFVLSLIE